MTRYATVFRTATIHEEIDYAVNVDFPQDFYTWSNDDKFAWLDEHSSGSMTTSEEYVSIDSIDNVMWDE